MPSWGHGSWAVAPAPTAPDVPATTLAAPRRHGVEWRREGAMTDRRYDEFRITLTARPDGSFGARAVAADGADISGEFLLPVAADELERVVVRIAHEAPRGAPAAAGRGVRPAAGTTLDAEQLGGALNDALLAGPIGAGYEAA